MNYLTKNNMSRLVEKLIQELYGQNPNIHDEAKSIEAESKEAQSYDARNKFNQLKNQFLKNLNKKNLSFNLLSKKQVTLHTI